MELGSQDDEVPTDPRDARAARFRVRPKLLLALGAVVVLLVGVSAALSGDDRDGDVPTTMVLPGSESRDGAGSSTGAVASDYSSPEDADAGEDSAAAGSGTDSALVVKTGSLTLEVRRGAYDKTLDLMTTKAIGLGGYVAQSSTSRGDDRPSGALVLRVPAAQFDSYLADVRRLGDVISEDTQGTDVSGEHADIEARLAALRATRDKLGTVLAQAKTVDEILLVQDRMTGVQTQIEQLQGQLDMLEDKVAMASLTVSLGEPGAGRVELGDPDERTIGGAWADARDAFADGIEGIVAWSGSAAVVLLVGGVLAGLGLLAWPRVRRHLP